MEQQRSQVVKALLDMVPTGPTRRPGKLLEGQARGEVNLKASDKVSQGVEDMCPAETISAIWGLLGKARVCLYIKTVALIAP